jgi:hypothetical protein
VTLLLVLVLGFSVGNYELQEQQVPQLQQTCTPHVLPQSQTLLFLLSKHPEGPYQRPADWQVV